VAPTKASRGPDVPVTSVENFFECYGFGSSKENINSKVFPRRKGGFCNECHARDTASALRIKNLQDICLGKPELNLFTVIFHKIIA
jgi:hypothetical protein